MSVLIAGVLGRTVSRHCENVLHARSVDKPRTIIVTKIPGLCSARTMKYRICHDFHIECDNRGLAVKSRFVESVLAL